MGPQRLQGVETPDSIHANHADLASKSKLPHNHADRKGLQPIPQIGIDRSLEFGMAEAVHLHPFTSYIQLHEKIVLDENSKGNGDLPTAYYILNFLGFPRHIQLAL